MKGSLLSSGRFSLVPGNHSHSPSATYAGVRYSPLSEIASTSLSLGARRRAARRPWKGRSWPHVPHLRPRHTLISTPRRGNDHKELLNLRDRQGALGKHALKKGHGGCSGVPLVQSAYGSFNTAASGTETADQRGWSNYAKVRRWKARPLPHRRSDSLHCRCRTHLNQQLYTSKSVWTPNIVPFASKATPNGLVPDRRASENLPMKGSSPIRLIDCEGGNNLRSTAPYLPSSA